MTPRLSVLASLPKNPLDSPWQVAHNGLVSGSSPRWSSALWPLLAPTYAWHTQRELCIHIRKSKTKRTWEFITFITPLSTLCAFKSKHKGVMRRPFVSSLAYCKQSILSHSVLIVLSALWSHFLFPRRVKGQNEMRQFPPAVWAFSLVLWFSSVTSDLHVALYHCWSCRGPGFSPSTHTAPHNHLSLQF